MTDSPQMPSYGEELVEKGLAVTIEVTADTVFADVETIASNSRFNNEYKQEAIQELLANGLDSLDDVVSKVEKRLNNQIAKLRQLGGFRTSPLPEVASIQYTHTLLRAEWERTPTHLVNPPAILAKWEFAIQSGDRVTARVLKDYAAPAIQGFAKTDREKMALLMEQTDDMYLTRENKDARVKLEEYEQYLQSAKIEANKARHRLSQTRFERGNLVDGRDVRLSRLNF